MLRTRRPSSRGAGRPVRSGLARARWAWPVVTASPGGAEPPAPLSFLNLPGAGRNRVVWQGPPSSPDHVSALVERVSGYRVDTLWRLSYGGWQAYAARNGAGHMLIDTLDRLVVVLA